MIFWEGGSNMSYSVRLLAYNKENLWKVHYMDGMISPEGEFYVIAERGDLDTRQDDFAEGYLSIKKNINVKKYYEEYKDMHPEFNSIRFSYKDVLVHLFGFVNYEYTNGHVEIEVPNPKYRKWHITDKQFELLEALRELNHDHPSDLLQALRYEKGMEENQYFYGKAVSHWKRR